ncbi:MAG: response regulator [Candidatus Cloacimonetes bacterium]|jgi:CheY-like chemotaxis protein|nr:response regulator [Candidatus Cloacimonadota bacterium]MDD4155210.1 response regulator [Candidatus Cloacimonadota bacterium]
MNNNYTLLIIEDNPDNYYLMNFLLSKHNFNIIGANNGLDGIKIALQKVPDAILLDIQLPEMDGYTVAVELKKQKSLKNIPIIVVTSYAMPGDREKALASGADGYIEKPINPETFVSEISQYLKPK